MNEMGQQSGIGKTTNQVKKIVGSDIGGLFNKLKNSSISEQFQSWIGKGENKPVTPEQVTQALGNEHLAKIADQTGVTPEQAARNIAQKLPTMVDKMTPDGQLPDQPVLSGMTAGGGNTAGEAGMGDLDAQLLVQLADQAGFRRLARLDLAAGEFPQARHRPPLGPLRDQHAAVGIDQRHRSDQHHRPAAERRRPARTLVREVQER